jgi:hypothetical protein
MESAIAPSAPARVAAMARLRCTFWCMNAAGPRMAGRHGVVRGSGGTRHRVRVLLDGSKNEMTLHSRFLDVENEPGRDP